MAKVELPVNEVIGAQFRQSWKGKADADAWAKELQDPHAFIFTACHTIDQAEQDPAQKIKLIPDLPHTRLHIQRRLIDRLHPLLQPKSRRMILSWMHTAEEVWQALRWPYSAIAVQSKKFMDSAELVHRHWTMLQALPADRFPVVKADDDGIQWAGGRWVKRYKKEGGTARLEFDNGSIIQALAEGQDQVRQYGYTMIRQEEIAFWDHQEESYDSAMECLQAAPGGVGGQLVAVTTANPCWFGDYIHDRELDEFGRRRTHKLQITTPIQGVKEWTTSTGAHVLEIHYTADPGKRSPEWIAHAKKGKRPRGWAREMEMQWDVYTGMPVYGDCFNTNLHLSPTPLVWDGQSTIIRGWDYGNTPACTIHTLVDGQWQWLAEICTDVRPLGSKEPPPSTHIGALADQVTQFCALKYPGAQFVDVDDPAGAQRAQTDSKSCRDVLHAKGITPIGGEVTVKARTEAMADLLTKLVTGARPAVLIDAGGCPMLVEGLKGGYRYAELGQTGRYSDQPEKNQFSHPMNCAEYVASRLSAMAPREVPENEYREPPPRDRGGSLY
jgi:hypothetical protein